MVLSADAVYAMDFAALVAEHAETGAEATMVTTEVEPQDAGRYGVVQASDGRIDAYAYKPDDPRGNLVANEVFVFRPATVLEALEAVADEGEDALEDLGDAVLPRLVDAGGVREHRLTGYWHDVGTIPAYWSAHRELLADEPPIDLDDPAWPVLTRAIEHRASARVLQGARVERGLLAPGSRVAGTVERSVIGRGAVVEAGATVRDSVVLPGACVRAGATVERAILDDRVEVGREARVGGADGEIALVGLQATGEPGAELPAGARFPEVDD